MTIIGRAWSDWQQRRRCPSRRYSRARARPTCCRWPEQIAVLCNKVEAHVAKLAAGGAAPVKLLPTSATLKARIADTVRYLNGLEPEDLAGAESHTYELSPPTRAGRWFGGIEYITLLVIPDFHFHVATAHDILRHWARRSASATILDGSRRRAEARIRDVGRSPRVRRSCLAAAAR